MSSRNSSGGGGKSSFGSMVLSTELLLDVEILQLSSSGREWTSATVWFASVPEGAIFISLNGLFDVEDDRRNDDGRLLFIITWLELELDTNECLLELRS